MKLISLNIEGRRHLETSLRFLETEDADIVCLMEAPEEMQDWLKERGYQTTFAPMTLRTQDGTFFPEGVLFASKNLHEAEAFYYHQPNEHMVDYIKNDKRGTIAHPVIFASIGNLNIATTHFTWNPAGETADRYQTNDLQNLLNHLQQKPAHVLCGDFNIPRHHNKLYEELVKHYTDAVPQKYNSSLDRNLHRAGQKPELQKLFDDFMVDYIFTQPPYTAENVRLEFSISDHAGVIATITQP